MWGRGREENIRFTIQLSLAAIRTTGLMPVDAMACTASCICASNHTAKGVGDMSAQSSASFLSRGPRTCNVPMLSVDAYPVQSRPDHYPRMVRARKHLPGTEREAAPGSKRGLESVRRLQCLHD